MKNYNKTSTGLYIDYTLKEIKVLTKAEYYYLMQRKRFLRGLRALLEKLNINLSK